MVRKRRFGYRSLRRNGYEATLVRFQDLGTVDDQGDSQYTTLESQIWILKQQALRPKHITDASGRETYVDVDVWVDSDLEITILGEYDGEGGLPRPRLEVGGQKFEVMAIDPDQGGGLKLLLCREMR